VDGARDFRSDRASFCDDAFHHDELRHELGRESARRHEGAAESTVESDSELNCSRVQRGLCEVRVLIGDPRCQLIHICCVLDENVLLQSFFKRWDHAERLSRQPARSGGLA